MPSPIEQNLHSLLPTTNLLPTQLVAIAGALLAQSKHAAPTLKTEEEIARTYTCCHIACERLAHKLALDVGKINPPCGPRVYKKLHSYLDGVLTAGKTSQPATPRTKHIVDVVNTKASSNAKTIVTVVGKKTPSSAKTTDLVVRRETPSSAKTSGIVVEKSTATPSKTPTTSTKRKRQKSMD